MSDRAEVGKQTYKEPSEPNGIDTISCKVCITVERLEDLINQIIISIYFVFVYLFSLLLHFSISFLTHGKYSSQAI